MSTILTCQTLLLWAKEELARSGVASPWRDARLLLAHALGTRLNEIIAYPEREVLPAKAHLFRTYVQRRAQREPVSRILGEREFWSLSFKLSAATLDPRPDSETLIEAVLKDFPDPLVPLKILDLGTGSGCLLLTLLREYRHAFGVGLDFSFEALLTARENACALQVEDRAFFVQGHWADSLGKAFDVILSNPPYIPGSEIPNLEPDVKFYDPLCALDGGEEGLEAYQILASSFPFLIHEKTRIYLEIGQGQEEAVEILMKEAGYVCAVWRPDLVGIKRCGVFRPAAKVSFAALR